MSVYDVVRREMASAHCPLPIVLYLRAASAGLRKSDSQEPVVARHIADTSESNRGPNAKSGTYRCHRVIMRMMVALDRQHVCLVQSAYKQDRIHPALNGSMRRAVMKSCQGIPDILLTVRPKTGWIFRRSPGVCFPRIGVAANGGLRRLVFGSDSKSNTCSRGAKQLHLFAPVEISVSLLPHVLGTLHLHACTFVAYGSPSSCCQSSYVFEYY